MQEINQLTECVIGCCIAVHRELGPVFEEEIYSRALRIELKQKGLQFQAEVPLPVAYKNCFLDCAYRLDFLVEKRLVIELKAIERILKIHFAQLLTYQNLAQVEHGLLINFCVELLKRGIHRQLLSNARAPKKENIVDQVKLDGAVGEILEAAYEVYSFLGPGLLASAYEECFAYEMSLRKIRFERNLKIPATYKNQELNKDVFLPFLIQGGIVCKVNSTSSVGSLHESQTRSLLHLSKADKALLINFSGENFLDNFRRYTNARKGRKS